MSNLENAEKNEEQKNDIPKTETKNEEEIVPNSVLEKELSNSKGEAKKIKDIIQEGDVYLAGDKIIFKHTAILKMIEFTDAEPLDPIPVTSYLDDKTSGYVFYCPVKFPNGEISRWGVGEANELNTDSFGKYYKANQAIIRGYARSFLHSKTIGLYDVYSEQEAESFNQQNVQMEDMLRKIGNLNAKLKAVMKQNAELKENNIRNNVKMNLVKTIARFPSAEEYILPETDKKYPNTSVITILADKNDITYVAELTKTLPQGHPILALIDFLTEKAKMDASNNKKYDLYNTSLQLLKELRTPANILDSLPTQQPKEEPTKTNNNIQTNDDNLNPEKPIQVQQSNEETNPGVNEVSSSSKTKEKLSKKEEKKEKSIQDDTPKNTTSSESFSLNENFLDEIEDFLETIDLEDASKTNNNQENDKNHSKKDK